MAPSSRPSSLLQVVAVLCLAGVAAGESGAPKPPIDFADFFNGNWTVETRSHSSSKGAEQSVTIGHYQMSKVEGRSGLQGMYWEDVLDPEAEGGMGRKRELWVRVDMDTPSSGVFYTAKVVEDEDAWAADYKRLFDIDFEAHANGARVSRGAWYGKKKGLYTLAITRQFNFELTIFTGDEGASGQNIQIMTARKPIPPKSLLMTYGPTVGIMVIFGASKLIKHFFGTQANKAAAVAAAGGGKKAQ
eukprot:CAMPEP_0173378266 /NCGR_PEP_ID=MMETSP1356-20130122/1453_1 /TAXON_ID=77927 ORGANISM="Hemiselmis virescens, Strain PCC157" /NCGR_SAMPLE_ID=MMETSP1356 /ASSEMBLY_ACC=CAM_ASM_000847 /LENGTH=244 /DNA_ID=CAMNT_0014331277 /DNA_START=9 /DNA_END=743 /DNA_ORIENTATION=+